MNVLPYMGMVEILSCDLDFYTHIGSAFLYKIWLSLAKLLNRGEEVEYHGNIHEFCPRVGADEPLGSIFFRIIDIQSHCQFPVRFSL